MTTALALLLCATFFILGTFHFYWLGGGNWGLQQVIPAKEHGEKTFVVPKFATLIVALGLMAVGFLYLNRVLGWISHLPSVFYWSVPVVFALRAIGDFKYVGLFKKVKNSDFAKADTKIFVPLCLGISTAGLLLQALAQ